MIALHKPDVLNHQKEYYRNKKQIEKTQKVNRRIRLEKDKVNVDRIREKGSMLWSIADISRLLTYKRMKGDETNKSANGDRLVFMQRWETRKHRRSPTCSPIDSDNEEEDFQNKNLQLNEEHDNNSNNENNPLSINAI